MKYLSCAIMMLLGLAASARAEGPTVGDVPASAKVARAALSETAPTIDGRLDEPAWQLSPAFDDFVERVPSLRGVPAERTTFRLLVDGEALYVGVMCHDTVPAAIRARTMQRDSFALFDDDAISVKVDPLRDQRTMYGFGMNAAGGRIDYRGINDGTWQVEVDLVWEGATAILADGWSAEFKIPWSTLGIDPSSPPSVSGLDLSRDQSRLHATYDWTLIVPPHQPIAASQFGLLVELPQLLAAARPVASRSTWALLPWALAGFDTDRSDGSIAPRVDAGLDFEAALGNGFSTTVTLNTDFAQVEVDDVTTNLDRFDLFLPEKREFFLKDGDVFDFGEAGWATLFHSRTIGLTAPDEATELPILAGVKVAGHTPGGLNVGALSVLTRPDGDVPWRLDSVLRLQQTFGSGSAVGLIATSRQSLEDASDHNVTVGVDGHLSDASSPLRVRSFFATSVDGASPDAANHDVVDVAGHVDALWRGELVRGNLGYAYFGPSFRPALGYFQRTGVHNTYGEIKVVPRLSGALQTLTIASIADLYFAAPGANLLDWTNQFALQLDWDSNAYLGLYGGPGEVTVDAFSISGHVVAAGRHGQGRVQVEGSTSTTETFSLGGAAELRQFFGGHAWVFDCNVIARAATWLRIGLSARSAFISLPSGDFVAPTINLRLASSLTSDLELSAFTGWSGLDDTIAIQSRLRWTFGQGDDLFAVWELALDEAGHVDHHSFIAKVALRLP